MDELLDMLGRPLPIWIFLLTAIVLLQGLDRLSRKLEGLDGKLTSKLEGLDGKLDELTGRLDDVEAAISLDDDD